MEYALVSCQSNNYRCPIHLDAVASQALSQKEGPAFLICKFGESLPKFLNIFLGRD